MQICPTGAIYNRYRTHYTVKGHDKKDRQSIDSLCPLCGLICPTTSVVSENNLLKIEGNFTGTDNRPDRGQLCYLGRFEPLKNKTERLTHPMIKNKNGIWEKTDWESAINQIVNKLNGIRDSHGADAIFGLASSMCSNETLFFFRELMSIGLNAGYVDTLDGSHYRTISNAWHKFDPSYREAPWEMIADADFVMIVGARPWQSHPVIHSLIYRNVLEKRTKVAIIGNGDYLSPFTAYHLPVNNGKEPLLVKAMLKEAIGLVKNPSLTSTWKRIIEETKKIDPAHILNKIGLDKNAIENFHEMVNSFMTSSNPLILTGEGLTGLSDISGLYDTINLSLLKGLINKNLLRIIILKPKGNSAGAWQLGISSNKEPSHTNKRKGGLLLLSGEDGPSHDFSDDINALDFLAIVSPYFPETLAQKGDIMIPRPLWMEEDGTYTSLDGFKTAYKKKVVNAPKGMKDTWQTLMSLADKIGFHPDLKTWDDLCRKAEESVKRDGEVNKV